MKDYYSILGVQKSASHNIIRDAYRRLAKKYHPDVNASPDAERIFKELNEAYEILGDPEKRASYDQPTFYEPIVQPEPVHRDKAYRRRRYPPSGIESEAKRMQNLMEEYKSIFLWVCRIGLAFSILIALDVLIPSFESNETITESIYSQGSSRTPASRTLITSTGRKFKYYPDDHSNVALEIHSDVTLQVSRIFSNVLTIRSRESENTVWIARIYSRLSFFPIILFISSCMGMLFKSNANLVLNCGTVSFVLWLICFFLVV